MSDDRRRRTLEALQPHIQRARAMSGWAPSGVVARHLDPAPPWRYEALARERVAGARAVLDMGTGSGDVLAQIAVGASARIVATEEWGPSLAAAQHRLAPIGIDVLHAQSIRLPFADASFDSVLNRHEELDPAEVARVLAPGGSVITQQVGPDSWPELSRYFARHDFGDLFSAYCDGFADAGLRIAQAEVHSERVAFGSLGDIVYMLLVTPWDVVGFDAAAEIDALIALEDGCRSPEGVVLTEQRFLIEAVKLA